MTRENIGTQNRLLILFVHCGGIWTGNLSLGLIKFPSIHAAEEEQHQQQQLLQRLTGQITRCVQVGLGSVVLVWSTDKQNEHKELLAARPIETKIY